MLDQKAIRRSDNPEAEMYVQVLERFIQYNRQCFEQGVRRGDNYIIPVHAVQTMIEQVEELMREFAR